MVKECGQGSLIAKLDLADAFKQISVRTEDWELLSLSCTDEFGISYTKYYVYTVLCFGLCSAPYLFNRYADALEYTIAHCGVSNICHFLDDFITWNTDEKKL